MRVTLGGKELRTLILSSAFSRESQWYEVRIPRTRIPAGNHTFKIEFTNKSDAPIELNLDELELLLIPAK